jgi:glutaredoxin
MMKTGFLRIGYVMLAVVAFACKSKTQKIDTSGNVTPEIQRTIVVYGSESCDHCMEFLHKVDSMNIEYTFKDAEASEQHYQELLQRVQAANFSGYVSFPVVVIDEQLHVRPEFEEFLTLISK